MLVGLSLDYIQITVLSFLVVSVLIYLLRGRLVFLLDYLINAGFLASIILILSSLFLPVFYDILADGTLRVLDLKTPLESLDKNLDKLPNTDEIWDELEGIWGGGEEDKIDVQISGAQSPSGVYFSVVSKLSLVYRVIAVIISFLMLIFITYLRYGMVGSSEIFNLQADLTKLRKDVIQLQKFHTP